MSLLWVYYELAELLRERGQSRRPWNSVWSRVVQGVSWIVHYSWIVTRIVRFGNYSGLNSQVRKLFKFLFYSEALWELFRSCSNRRGGSVTKRWIAVWSKSDPQIWSAFCMTRPSNASNRPISNTFPSSVHRSPRSISLDALWPPSETTQTNSDTIGISLRRSETYSTIHE